jgi:CRISPR/Cas system CMR-associated protein Cmr5 small subunit
MQSIIDDLLAEAIRQIANTSEIRETENNENSKIKGIYESYLSQFGPMANQIGIRSTLAVYYNKDGSKSKGDRKYILKLIFDVLKGYCGLNFAPNQNFKEWINTVLTGAEINEADESLLLDASIALKRAIRTFTLTEKYFLL